MKLLVLYTVCSGMPVSSYFYVSLTPQTSYPSHCANVKYRQCTEGGKITLLSSINFQNNQQFKIELTKLGSSKSPSAWISALNCRITFQSSQVVFHGQNYVRANVQACTMVFKEYIAWGHLHRRIYSINLFMIHDAHQNPKFKHCYMLFKLIQLNIDLHRTGVHRFELKKLMGSFTTC